MNGSLAIKYQGFINLNFNIGKEIERVACELISNRM